MGVVKDRLGKARRTQLATVACWVRCALPNLRWLRERFQVKRIMVIPGEKLSLQLHHHRAEHWVVVSGTARVTRDGVEELLSENQSTYISLRSACSFWIAASAIASSQ